MRLLFKVSLSHCLEHGCDGVSTLYVGVKICKERGGGDGGFSITLNSISLVVDTRVALKAEVFATLGIDGT